MVETFDIDGPIVVEQPQTKKKDAKVVEHKKG